jgi:hypothetical protein
MISIVTIKIKINDNPILKLIECKKQTYFSKYFHLNCTDLVLLYSYGENKKTYKHV